MELFTTALANEMINGLFTGLAPAWEFRGLIAAEALKLVVLPFYEFSLASCLVAFGWMVIFWKNKGLFFSGVSHSLDLFSFDTDIARKLLLKPKP